MPRHNGNRPVYSALTGQPAINCNTQPPIPLQCCGFYVGDVPFYPQSIRFITSGLSPCCNVFGTTSSRLTFFGGDFNLQANVPRTSTGCHFYLAIPPGELGTPTGYKRTYYSDTNCSVFDREDGEIVPITNPVEVGLRDIASQDGCNSEQNVEAFMNMSVASIEPAILLALMPRLDCFNQFHPNELVCNFDINNPPSCLTLARNAEVAGGGVQIIPQDYAPLDPGFGPEDFL